MAQPPYQQQPYQGPGPYQQQPYQQQPGQGQYQAPYQGQYQQPYQQQQQQYGQPQYQGAPQGYQQQYQPDPQYQMPQQQTGYEAHGGLSCRLCGSAPAAQATFRAVVGAAIMHTIWTAPGPYCRDCGVHTFRRQTAKSFTGGWCSLGAIVLTPIFLLMNLSARGKVADLPAPQPRGDGRAPLDPGRPVFQRPGAYLYPMVATFLLLVIIVSNLSR